jgi:hypothetical protein
MTSNIHRQGSGTCTANITKNRNRLKIYKKGEITNPNLRNTDGFLFLNDKENFEIELFNPHSKKVLAKIYLNGKLISQSGIVLRPGERVFLDRFIDENCKFEFSTYQVQNTNEAQNAIRDNGFVKVEFYHEYEVLPYNPYPGNIWIGNSGTGIGTGGWGGTYYSGQNIGTTFTTNDSNNLSFGGTTLTNSCYFSSDISGSLGPQGPVGNTRSKSIETGTVEKGGTSQQSFEYVNASFNSFCTEKFEFQILPVSSKPVEMNSIRNYCSNCGTRIKDSNWKFCPKCGNKF